MKTRIYIAFFIITLLFINLMSADRLKAQQPSKLLNKANALYNESAYDSAAIVYEDIINKGYSSAVLYYNLGNTYYKLKNYPLSILYYEKSLKLSPNNEDTKQNLALVNQFITDKIEPVPEFMLNMWWHKLSNIFSADTWAIISIVIFGIFFICLFFYLTARTKILKKTMFFIGILIMIMTMCSFIISMQKYQYVKSHNEAIVITSTITVKSSPSASSVDLFVLHEGSKVKVLDMTSNWDKIKIANGSIGWLPSSTIIKY